MPDEPAPARGAPMTPLWNTVWSWIWSDRVHQAAAAVAGLVLLLAVLRIRRAVGDRLAAARARRAAARLDGEDAGLEAFTVYVALMATALSINGMWHVFSETIVLPTMVRLVACTVLESTGFALMRAARDRIKAKKPATRDVVAVWLIAGLSGGLSAAASHSPLEAAIRALMPSLAVRLMHSWMLPEHDEITLTKYEKGKRAWRFVKARRRLARARNPLSRYAAAALVNLENDRLTKRSLMTGDASSVLAAAERAATDEALAGLGMDSGNNTRRNSPGNAAGKTAGNSGGNAEGHADPASGNTGGSGNRRAGNSDPLASGRNLSVAELADLIAAAHPGTTPGVRQVMAAFNVGYGKATAALDTLGPGHGGAVNGTAR